LDGRLRAGLAAARALVLRASPWEVLAELVCSSRNFWCGQQRPRGTIHSKTPPPHSRRRCVIAVAPVAWRMLDMSILQEALPNWTVQSQQNISKGSPTKQPT